MRIILAVIGNDGGDIAVLGIIMVVMVVMDVMYCCDNVMVKLWC